METSFLTTISIKAWAFRSHLNNSSSKNWQSNNKPSKWRNKKLAIHILKVVLRRFWPSSWTSRHKEWANTIWAPCYRLTSFNNRTSNSKVRWTASRICKWMASIWAILKRQQISAWTCRKHHCLLRLLILSSINNNSRIQISSEGVLALYLYIIF